MIVSSAFRGKRYVVLGLARSGMATVESLLASGAEVTAWDRREGPRDELAGRATIADPLLIDLAGFDGVVVSPGVPLNTHPIVARAQAAGVPLIGDVELFAQARGDLPPHRVAAITGTNGKSTTTALLHHLIESAGLPARMGGNIGLPILAQDPLPEGGVYVLELSSYQIDITFSLDCEATGLTNITPDHLDRYDGFASYAASKAKLFAMQSEGNFAIFGCADAPTTAIQRQEVLRRPQGRAVCARIPFWKEGQSNWPSLQGPHNLQNAAIAGAMALDLGLSLEQILAGLASFRGLPHRMERLGEFDGVLFINDSKATNPASTAPALAAFPPNPDRRVHWICGGLPKGDDLDECAPNFGNVAAAYTIGEAGPRFAELLEPFMQVQRCEMLCEATTRAMAAARPGDVILLSPACASFDQFRDYETRGDTFRKLVAQLTGDAEADGEPCTANSPA
ncbi:UDP-N-acetylmuramoyl-L-alanine--D-glutamate ligase [Altererythrobacter sp. Root672]|uniref:UDP-N-acetylmuramoyl-L-alanine--D-glutamate ligase n=1 Tax=Altererythrobacter sp. Root672 TaxID=1736584 RepID=UPI0006FF6B99|nr:UDP-N-acetylmuramoyl-L-alanine--D-glutamate ligase [Altererythrobacter sp. Root672]KRA84256.1 UDP-N-acetylmuramoylalanine--D-glutamate ligase [Altererythrobacter sp. Root672]